HGDDVGVESQLEGVIDASVGGAADRLRYSRAVRDQCAGIVRIELDLGDGVGVGPHTGSVEELGFVLRSVEIDLQVRVLWNVADPRRHRNGFPCAIGGASVRIAIDANRLNIEKNILKVRRRNAHKSYLDLRR